MAEPLPKYLPAECYYNKVSVERIQNMAPELHSKNETDII